MIRVLLERLRQKHRTMRYPDGPMQVSAFVDPDWLVEIELDAVIPE